MGCRVVQQLVILLHTVLLITPEVMVVELPHVVLIGDEEDAYTLLWHVSPHDDAYEEGILRPASIKLVLARLERVVVELPETEAGPVQSIGVPRAIPDDAAGLGRDREVAAHGRSFNAWRALSIWRYVRHQM